VYLHTAKQKTGLSGMESERLRGNISNEKLHTFRLDTSNFNEYRKTKQKDIKTDRQTDRQIYR